jgi:hypothetical protein
MSEAKWPEWSRGPSGRVTGDGPPQADERPPRERPAGEALARLWQGADPSRGRHLEAIAELRERKRRERTAPSRSRRAQQSRDGQPEAQVATAAAPAGLGADAVPGSPRASAPVPQAVLECERCGRSVEQAGAERVAVPSALHEPVEHLLCPRCAGEVRRGLLRLLAGEEPLPAEAPSPHPVAAAPEPPPVTQEQPAPSSLAARLGWVLLRMAVYLLIALATFALVSWLSVR